MNKGSEKATRTNRRFLILLLVFAAGSGVAKDLVGFKDLTSGLASWLHTGRSVYASAMSPAERSCPESVAQSSAEQFHWSGRVAPGQSIEIKGINGSIEAEPTVGGDIEVVATKKARRSDPASVEIKVVPHANGVTICAVYPSEYADRPNTCEPSGGNSSGNNNVRNNDVSVNFAVRVPAGIEFIGRTVNGEITANSLSGNVRSKTVNGGINISTAGYAQAKTVNGDIKAKLGNANWTDPLEFKTVNGGITLDLPATISTKVDADTFNGEIDSDFPLTMLGRISRKHVSGTIGGGGRELILKTLNGSIHLRRLGGQ
jgi:Putative adhesin